VVCARLIKHDLTLAEPIILALDTSSKGTSIAVARGASVLRCAGEPADEKRAETLWTEARSLLADLGMTIRDIDVFAVCIGPGGFTGLRVGMASSMGFSAATGKPLVGVTSLEAVAFAASPAVAVCAIVTAYKGEVYSQLFSFDRDGMPVAQNDPMASTLVEALDRVALQDGLIFAGEAAEAGAEVIMKAAGSRAEGKWKTNRSDHRLAEDVARLACLKYERGGLKTGEGLKACYVRRPEAEIKLSLGLLGSKIKRSMKSE